MIHRPSGVACSPFGCGPGDLKTISTFPALRTGMDVRFRAGAARSAGAAAAAARNALRLIIGILLYINQNVNFAPNCTVRFPPALVIRPTADVFVMLKPGLPNVG